MSFSTDLINPHLDNDKGGRKLTLKTHRVDLISLNPLNPDQIKEIRLKFNMSRSIFAKKLRTSPRTLERWEQGISKPNQQAAVLMLLVFSFNDMLERIASLGETSQC
jgi:putative transcriptional regulator